MSAKKKTNEEDLLIIDSNDNGTGNEISFDSDENSNLDSNTITFDDGLFKEDKGKEEDISFDFDLSKENADDKNEDLIDLGDSKKEDTSFNLDLNKDNADDKNKDLSDDKGDLDLVKESNNNDNDNDNDLFGGSTPLEEEPVDTGADLDSMVLKFISDLESRKETIKGVKDSKNIKISNLEEKITNLQLQVEELKSAISELDSETNKIDNKINLLSEEKVK